MLTVIWALKPTAAAVGVTFTIPDPEPSTAVNSSACVAEVGVRVVALEATACVPAGIEGPELGAVGLPVRLLQATTNTNPAMKTPIARDKRDMWASMIGISDLAT